METENNFQTDSQIENKNDNSKIYLLVIVILLILLIGSGIFIYLLMNNSNVVKTTTTEDKIEETSENNDDYQDQNDTNAEVNNSDDTNEENEDLSLDTQEIAGVSIVKYVDKYKESLDIMREEDADLFIEYSINSLDQSLDKGLITQEYYDESINEINSFSKEEIVSMLEMANDFGMTDRDETLPSDKFMDVNETYNITEDEDTVTIEVVYTNSDSSETNLVADFFVDSENDEVFFTFQ